MTPGMVALSIVAKCSDKDGYYRTAKNDLLRLCDKTTAAWDGHSMYEEVASRDEAEKALREIFGREEGKGEEEVCVLPSPVPPSFSALRAQLIRIFVQAPPLSAPAGRRRRSRPRLRQAALARDKPSRRIRRLTAAQRARKTTMRTLLRGRRYQLLKSCVSSAFSFSTSSRLLI